MNPFTTTCVPYCSIPRPNEFVELEPSGHRSEANLIALKLPQVLFEVLAVRYQEQTAIRRQV